MLIRHHGPVAILFPKFGRQFIRQFDAVAVTPGNAGYAQIRPQLAAGAILTQRSNADVVYLARASGINHSARFQ
jgi:hypothetical protein